MDKPLYILYLLFTIYTLFSYSDVLMLIFVTHLSPYTYQLASPNYQEMIHNDNSIGQIESFENQSHESISQFDMQP